MHSRATGQQHSGPQDRSGWTRREVAAAAGSAGAMRGLCRNLPRAAWRTLLHGHILAGQVFVLHASALEHYSASNNSDDVLPSIRRTNRVRGKLHAVAKQNIVGWNVCLCSSSVTKPVPCNDELIGRQILQSMLFCVQFRMARRPSLDCPNALPSAAPRQTGRASPTAAAAGARSGSV